jgi:cold shock CspA family protein
MSNENNRVHGVVMSWDIGGKGFGFIHPDQHNETRDCFYLCRRDLAAGVHNLTATERVTFLMSRDESGLRASNIKPEAPREIEPPVDRDRKRNMRHDGN